MSHNHILLRKISAAIDLSMSSSDADGIMSFSST